MNITTLAAPFTLNIKHIPPLTYLTLNGVTSVLNNIQLEELEYSLADLAHAIMLYKSSEDIGCNTLQSVI